MVIYCCIVGCANRQRKTDVGQVKISFHRFPFNRPAVLQQWVDSIGRKEWNPTPTSFICSAHFLPNAFLHNPWSKKRLLKHDAVPTLFNLLHYSIENDNAPKQFKNGLVNNCIKNAVIKQDTVHAEVNLPTAKIILKEELHLQDEEEMIIEPQVKMELSSDDDGEEQIPVTRIDVTRVDVEPPPVVKEEPHSDDEEVPDMNQYDAQEDVKPPAVVTVLKEELNSDKEDEDVMRSEYEEGFVDPLASTELDARYFAKHKRDKIRCKQRVIRFNPKWLEDPLFTEWVRAVENDTFSVLCSVCKTTIALSTMGKQALKCHMQGKRHRLALQNKINVRSEKDKGGVTSCSKAQPSTSISCVTKSQGLSSVIGTPGLNTATKSFDALQNFCENDKVTKAEILWCLQVITSQSSLHGIAESVAILKAMFPDSDIAKKMQLYRTKVAYTILHGLAPYFHCELEMAVLHSNHFVVSFEESLNKVTKSLQMDLSVRFWDNTKGAVVNRYFTSVFLVHPTTEDLIRCFKDVLSGLNLNKLLQVTLNGPNVKICFLKALREDLLLNRSAPTLVDIGTFSMYTLHKIFRDIGNYSEWNLVEFMSAIYDVFEDIPARKADYTLYSGSTAFPLKVSTIKCLANVKVAERALKILPCLTSYLIGVVTHKKEPNCISYCIMKEMCNDKLLGPKLAFFLSLAAEVEPFLIEFQCDVPMTPFLYESFSNLLKSIMARCIKKEVLELTETVMDIDFQKEENLIPSEEIEFDYTTRNALHQAQVSQFDILKFKDECQDILLNFCIRLIHESPLRNKLVQGISCFDPTVISKSEEISKQRLSHALEVFVANKWISLRLATNIDENFKHMLANPTVVNKMKTFSRKVERLDHFWQNIINYADVRDLMPFLKLIFILSHGNTGIGKTFPVNNECLIENEREESLIAQQQIYDAVSAAGGVLGVQITNNMMLAAQLAHSKCIDVVTQQSEKRHN